MAQPGALVAKEGPLEQCYRTKAENAGTWAWLQF